MGRTPLLRHAQRDRTRSAAILSCRRDGRACLARVHKHTHSSDCSYCSSSGLHGRTRGIVRELLRVRTISILLLLADGRLGVGDAFAGEELRGAFAEELEVALQPQRKA